jgi:two-component system, cell cycle sensor histidine kinase and response regulator CckA
MNYEVSKCEGSEFKSLATASESPEAKGQTDRPKTILLVEDEAFVRDVIDEVLQFAGYRVLKTQNAEEALLVQEQAGGALDLLLTDVVMPGRSGRDLARQLEPQFPGMKTIFMSGYGENLALLGAQRSTSISYLAKPFSVPALLQKVKEIFNPEESSFATM